MFDGPAGKETLTDLFGGKSQLMVYHFMLGPRLGTGLPELLVPAPIISTAPWRTSRSAT